MGTKFRKAWLYGILEGTTIIIALLLYVFIGRPKEKLNAEYSQTWQSGEAALNKGDFSEAKKDFEASLLLAERQNKGIVEVASMQSRLADAERGLGDYREAHKLDELTQPVFEKYQSRWEARYADFLMRMAETCRQVGVYGEAEERNKQALALQEKVFGPNSEYLVPTLFSITYFYYDRGKGPVAEAFAQRSLKICQLHFGTKHPATAYARSMLSLVYDLEGRFPEAEHLARSALPILESAAPSPDDPVIASTLNRLGLALDGERKWPEAEAAFTKALAMREKRSGAGPFEDLVSILHNLARLYGEEGKTHEASAFRQRADSISASRTK